MLTEPERKDAVTSRTLCDSDDIIRYKKRAKRLRKFLRVLGIDIKHSHALEAMARIHGLNDYNTLVGLAKVGRTPIECLDACERAMRRSERLRKYLLAGGRVITSGQAQEFIALMYPDKEEANPLASAVLNSRSSTESRWAAPRLIVR